MPFNFARFRRFGRSSPDSGLRVPVGQSVYDPTVFGRYDRATQAVVPLADQPGVWDLRFDEMLPKSHDHAREWPSGIERDRYKLVLPLLAPGGGICLDACTGSPEESTQAYVERLGYTYMPIDLEPPEGIRREDVTSMSFEAESIARILSLDTLEHIKEYPRALAEFYRVLEPGGVLLVHVPAYFFDRAHSATIDPANDPWGHERYFSGHELLAEVMNQGFTLLRVQLHLDYGALLCAAGKGR